jgi:hypothetical protein
LAKERVIPDLTSELMAEALQRSGYLLENRIEDYLSTNGFVCELNAAYPDPTTGKIREMDLHAYTGSHAGKCMLLCNLLIECMNNPQPVVFMARRAGPYEFYSPEIIGWPQEINHDGQTVALSTFLDDHTSDADEVATQYCSFKWKEARGMQDGMWMACHDEEQFDAFRKLADEYEYYRGRAGYEPYSISNIELNYFIPVLVLQGELFRAELVADTVKLSPSKHIRFIKRTVEKDGESKIYRIDVVTEAGFSEFVGGLGKTFGEFADHVNEHRDAIAAGFEKARTDSLPIKWA